MPEADPVAEAERVLRICTACMFCDGLCPVFPAIDGKHGFSLSDLSYLSNLCHNCRGCWYACQYAPPHPFAVNLPATLSEIRRRSYADYLWPAVLRRVFKSRVATAVLVVTGLVSGAAGPIGAPPASLFAADASAGAFYRVVPWSVMVSIAGSTFLLAVLAIGIATARFWRAISPHRTPWRHVMRGIWPALHDIVTLRHLGGGGPGCNDIGERTSRRRRVLHHLTAGGFLLSTFSTVVAAAYHHVFVVAAPYPVMSLPVMLGVAGGLSMTVGCAGLLWLEHRADRQPSNPREVGLNVVFLLLLALVALSGLAVLAFRNTPAMGLLLIGHLATVVGSFAVLPFTKALHAPFRAAALLRAAIDRQPHQTGPIINPGALRKPRAGGASLLRPPADRTDSAPAEPKNRE